MKTKKKNKKEDKPIRYKGRYVINCEMWGKREVYIADKEGEMPCFERFVLVWDAKTNKYLGFCGQFWFLEHIVLDEPEDKK